MKNTTKTLKKLWPVWAALGIGLITFLVLYFFAFNRPNISKTSPDLAPKITINESHPTICPNQQIIDLDYESTDHNGEKISEPAIIKYLGNNLATITAVDSEGNQATRIIKNITKDKTAPLINLNGSDIITTFVNHQPEIPAPTVSDNCDKELEITTIGEYNIATVGDYEIKYEARDSSGNLTSISRTIRVIPENSGIVYLTFDDGPSEYTNQLLDILKKYNVKATFFVTGSGSDDVLRREYEEGHAIGLHTFVHNYQYVYQNVETFMNDIYRIQERVKNATGYTSHLIRFPGGSSNTVSKSYDGGTHIMSQLVNEVGKHGFVYFDWNVSSGDAGGAYTPDAVYMNVINSLRPNGVSVVLQHDSKQFSIEAVERIIEYGLANGYTFSKLDESSPTAHHGINN